MAKSPKAVPVWRASRRMAASIPVESRDRRVLYISHGHPKITPGGAEIAAYALFAALRQKPGYQAWFLGCRTNTTGQRLGVAITQPFGADEFVYQPGSFDWFKFANRDPNFPSEFRNLLKELKPDVIHFHHFTTLGMEALQIAKETLPNANVILTVHEYLLICNAYGQMVTSKNQQLCYQSSLDACHSCFPEHSTADFFLREKYCKMFLSAVDTFIAPSRFLANRLCAWGIDPTRMHVIENLVEASGTHEQTSPAANPARPLKVGFFGQISRLKGIAVLLRAAVALEKDAVTSIEFEIYGEYRGQPMEFQTEFLKLLDAAGGNVRYHGSYRPEQVDSRMSSVDIVIVPSIWWENSPVVIQEAIRNKRPIICSDIGGMAEKVRDGLDGWHFPVGSVPSLVGLLTKINSDRDLITAMTRSIRSEINPDDVLQTHLQLYNSPSYTGILANT